MQRKPVESSNLASVGYDAASLTLEVEFKDSGVYQFFNVPSVVHDTLMISHSVGGYFQRNIRGQYQFKKLEPKPFLPAAAIEQLTLNQKQLDQDGVMVGVSREALTQVLDYLKVA